MLNATYMQGKPFFDLWQDTDISYDSVLGLSLTLITDSTTYAVYISRYRKTTDDLELTLVRIPYATTQNLDDNTDEVQLETLAHIKSSLTPGIQTIFFEESDKLKSGSITVINTDIVEYSDKLIKISPMYIQYIDQLNKLPATIKIDDDPAISAYDANFIFSGNEASVDFTYTEDIPEAYIKFSPQETPIITGVNNTHIFSFAGIAVDKEHRGYLQLPENFQVTKVNDSFAVIRPYTYETCATSNYTPLSSKSYDVNITHSEDYPLPLDVCFYKDEHTGKWILNPYRIDKLDAPDGVNYLVLNAKHDTGETPDNPQDGGE